MLSIVTGLHYVSTTCFSFLLSLGSVRLLRSLVSGTAEMRNGQTMSLQHHFLIMETQNDDM